MSNGQQKYFAHKVKAAGHTFDSKAEYMRYLELLQMQRRGRIHDLELQKEFELLPKQVVYEEKQLKTKVKIVERVDERAVTYHSDFFYFDTMKDRWVIEEVKSQMTMTVRDYPLRRKLVKMMVRRLNEERRKMGENLYEFNEIVQK